MLVIRQADPDYASEVGIWLTRITGTAVGAWLVGRLGATSHRITIRKPEPVDPPNAWTEPDLTGGGPAPGRSSVIHFDPRDWPSPADPAGRPADLVFYGMLLEAARLQSGGDFEAAPPASVKTYFEQYRAQRPARLG